MKSHLLQWLARPGEDVAFHASTLSAFGAGLFACLTASELGVMAPILIAAGLYVMVFAVGAEVLYWARHMVAALVRKHVGQQAGERK